MKSHPKRRYISIQTLNLKKRKLLSIAGGVKRNFVERKTKTKIKMETNRVFSYIGEE